MLDLDNTKNRILIALILGLILVGLSYIYSQENEKYLPNPSYKVILNNYPLNSMVEVGGDVKKISSDGFTLDENYKGTLMSFKILSNVSVGVGDKVNILGILGPNNTIYHIDKIVVSELWKYYFILIRSFLAMIFLIILFFNYWTFDKSKFLFRRR
jgi:hypothetical protein